MPRRLPSPLIPRLLGHHDAGERVAIIDELRSVILSGDVPAGTVIPLREVADAFGVSQIPVREALKTLMGEGIIAHRRNVGYRVTQLTRAELREIYLIRGGLESAALTAAVAAASERDFERARSVHRQCASASAARNGREYNRHSREFHEALTVPCGMQRLMHMLQSAWNLTEPVQPMAHIGNADRAALNEDHGRMLAAFTARDSAGLLAAANEHNERLALVVAGLGRAAGLTDDAV
ncbi:GntR family transcriptional regulator [Hoyosella subflava]|nr:GntR family transcriptional regulator [Hoyosella subflava]